MSTFICCDNINNMPVDRHQKNITADNKIMHMPLGFQNLNFFYLKTTTTTTDELTNSTISKNISWSTTSTSYFYRTTD